MICLSTKSPACPVFWSPGPGLYRRHGKSQQFLLMSITRVCSIMSSVCNSKSSEIIIAALTEPAAASKIAVLSTWLASAGAPITATTQSYSWRSDNSIMVEVCNELSVAGVLDDPKFQRSKQIKCQSIF